MFLSGLIQHQSVQRVQLEYAFAHVIHHPSRGADDHMNTPLQPPCLARIILAAVDRRRSVPAAAKHLPIRGVFVGSDEKDNHDRKSKILAVLGF